MMEKITKIAENNVEVFKEVTVKDIKDTDKIILEYSESYGQSKIDDQLTKVNQELIDANNLDEKQYKTDLISKTQSKINRIIAVLKSADTVTKTDKDGKSFLMYDKEIMGNLDNVGVGTESLNQAKKELEENNLFNEKTYKQKLIDDAQEKIDRLNLIQTEMDK